MGGLIGLSALSKNGLQKAGQAPMTSNVGSGENYLYLGEVKTQNNIYMSEVLLVIGVHRPTWSVDVPAMQLIKSNTDSNGNPKVSAFNIFGTTSNNIFRAGNKIYLKNIFTYGTAYSVLRLTSSDGLINLVMQADTAPSETDLEVIL